jgi:uncharacterized protein
LSGNSSDKKDKISLEDKMKKVTGILLVAAVLVLTLAGCLTVEAYPSPQIRTINVGGEGIVYVTPDVAYVNIGVTTQGDTVTQALDKNTAAAQGIRDSLKKLGVEDKDIQTSGFNINPSQDYAPDGSIVRSYFTANNTVYVTVRDLAKMGSILDTTVRNGANTINSISFDVTDKEKALSEARAKAMQNAEKQAQEAATAAGATLGPVQNISMYTNSSPAPVYYDGKGGGAANMASMPVPIATGQMTVSVSTNVTYELK